ncbi:MAG: pyk [Clostridiales bacterium]|nr:pyk [Clostridiales bacterium]
MRKTKIVCTIGPTSDNEEMLEKLISSGMDAARLNFSHGSYEEHGSRIELVKRLRKKISKPIAIILDTKGPEIRTGNFKGSNLELKEGQKFTITTRQLEGDESICSVSYEKLNEDLKPGDRVLISDGLIELMVESIEGQDIHCKVVNGGPIGNHKNINVPNVVINLPGITEKDINDIRFGIEKGIDFIAASFVRKAADVMAIRKVLEDNGGTGIHIISKIENQEGVDNIDEIIKLSDGIMVARGDLGVQIPVEEVPIAQKMIIEKCNTAGKPVITATQMLDSMIRNPRPTRAEASDVANAILDGTDAIMLSGETANGKYPVESVSTMAKIASKAETNINFKFILRKRREQHILTVPDAISLATVSTAMQLNASAVITATQSGHTARIVSKYRPQCEIIAVTPYWQIARKLSIVWGVYPIIAEKMESADEVIDKSVNEAIEHGYIKKGDLVVIAAGVPIGYAGTTNLMKVHIVGDVLVKGTGIGESTYGNACTIRQETNIDELVNPGEILVVKKLKKEYSHLLDRVNGVITEEQGITSDTVVSCINMGIPVIVGAASATEIIRTGTLITMNPGNGTVYSGKTNVM